VDLIGKIGQGSGELQGIRGLTVFNHGRGIRKAKMDRNEQELWGMNPDPTFTIIWQ
jgi:hypothetical protein